MSLPAPPSHLTPPGVTRRRFGGRWTALRGPREFAKAALLVGPAIQDLQARDAAAYEGWVGSPGVWTSTGTAAFPLGVQGQDPVALMRLSMTGGDRLSRESTVFSQLSAASLPESLDVILPRRLATGQVRDCTYVVDSLLPGQPAEPVAHGSGWTWLQRSALAAVADLHRATAVSRVVDADLLHDWVDAPISVLRSTLRRFPHVASSAHLGKVREELAEALLGRSVQVSYVHGDFWPGNLLVEPAHERLTGIVDWDLASPDELPVHDYLHLLLYRRRMTSGREMGHVVNELLNGHTPFTREELEALSGADWCFPDGPPAMRTLLLLYWLRYVAAISLQQHSYVTHSVRVWELRNVHRVLNVL